MFKSLKMQFILLSIASILFTIYTYLNINNPDLQISKLRVNLYYFITIYSAFVAGLHTQKYIQSKREK